MKRQPVIHRSYLPTYPPIKWMLIVYLCWRTSDQESTDTIIAIAIAAVLWVMYFAFRAGQEDCKPTLEEIAS